MPKKKILLKLSGEFLCSTDSAIDIKRVFALAREVAVVRRQYQLGLVIGGGNIFRGRQMSKQKIVNPAAWHFVGMESTVVNALALKAAFDQLKTPAIVISAFDKHKVNPQKYFSQGMIVIFAAGTGRPFVTTDSGAVERALEIKADILLKGTKVDGVYSADPKKNPRAKKIARLSAEEYLKIKNASIFDQAAALLAAKKKLPIYIFKWGKGSLKKAITLKARGTLIS